VTVLKQKLTSQQEQNAKLVESLQVGEDFHLIIQHIYEIIFNPASSLIML
jgi:hypothetical protein